VTAWSFRRPAKLYFVVLRARRSGLSYRNVAASVLALPLPREQRGDSDEASQRKVKMDPEILAALKDIRSSLQWLKMVVGSFAVIGVLLLTIVAWAVLTRLSGRAFELAAEQKF